MSIRTKGPAGETAMKPDEVHEQHEHLEHAAHGEGGGHGGGQGKRIAILISTLAALLAVMEAAGNSSQTEQLARNIDTSDTYSFYQAKTIRSSVLRTSVTMVQAVVPDSLSPEQKARVDKTLADWKSAADHLDSDPGGDGRKELLEKAKRLTAQRDEAANAYHTFEYGSAALQLSIVLASASLITSMPVLAGVSVGLGGVGAFLGGLGWLKPNALHELLHGGHEGHGEGHGDTHAAPAAAPAPAAAMSPAAAMAPAVPAAPAAPAPAPAH